MERVTSTRKSGRDKKGRFAEDNHHSVGNRSGGYTKSERFNFRTLKRMALNELLEPSKFKQGMSKLQRGLRMQANRIDQGDEKSLNAALDRVFGKPMQAMEIKDTTAIEQVAALTITKDMSFREASLVYKAKIGLSEEDIEDMNENKHAEITYRRDDDND